MLFDGRQQDGTRRDSLSEHRSDPFGLQEASLAEAEVTRVANDDVITDGDPEYGAGRVQAARHGYIVRRR
jgi:hypothetical protein